MGKKNFDSEIRSRFADGRGNFSCKVSYFSDTYDKSARFAGVIIYHFEDELEWVTPKTFGSPPDERISCNITYYEELNVLIINGGRNDRTKRLYLNDIFLLNLITFNWTRVYTFSAQPKERGEHCSVFHSNKLLIFGGICAMKYIGSDLFVINFGM
jgi:hypothetical protein